MTPHLVHLRDGTLVVGYAVGDRCDLKRYDPQTGEKLNSTETSKYPVSLCEVELGGASTLALSVRYVRDSGRFYVIVPFSKIETCSSCRKN